MGLRKVLSIMMTVVLCCTLNVAALPSQALAADAVTKVGLEVTYGQTEARSMLDLMNEFRTGSDAWAWNSSDTEKEKYTGLQELKYDYELERVAKYRAAEIALSFSHTMLDGKSYSNSMLSGNWTWGENIAAGSATAKAAFTQWQETSYKYAGQGHRRNMLSSKFTVVGIGHAICGGTHYWVQVFAAPALDSTKTAADNAKQTVDLDIADSLIENGTASASPAKVSLKVGESAQLPTVNAGIQLADAWPAKKTPVSVPAPKWTVADSSVAEISGGKVVAKAAGSTTLSATAHVGSNKRLSVPITVTDASGKTDEGGKCTIAKAKPTISVATATKIVKVKAAKKKAQSFNIGAKSSSGGKITYKVTKKNKSITFKAGKATLKKGAKKGTYSISVKVTSAAKGKYAKASKTFVVSFRVK